MTSLFKNRKYDRMGSCQKGKIRSAGSKQDTHYETLLAKYNQYIESPTQTPAFGIGLVDDKHMVNVICVDFDCHREKDMTDVEFDNRKVDVNRQVTALSTELSSCKINFKIEENDGSSGYHLWITHRNLTHIDEIKNDLILCNKAKVVEVYPRVDEDGNATNFIRLPGLYKDGTSKSFWRDGGQRKDLVTIEAVEEFFTACENSTVTLPMIVSILKEHLQKGNEILVPGKVSTKAAQTSTNGSSVSVPSSNDSLQRLVEWIGTSDTFKSSSKGKFNFNANDLRVDCMKMSTISRLAIKDDSMAHAIKAAMDRPDRSNDAINSFVAIDYYETTGIPKAVSFFRNRDNAGISFFDDTRSWTISDLAARLPDIPELAKVHQYIQKECRYTPALGQHQEIRVSWDFSKDVPCEPYYPVMEGRLEDVCADVIGYIRRILGSKITIKFNLSKRELPNTLETLLVTSKNYYPGPFPTIFAEICDSPALTEKEMKNLYETITKSMSIDTEVTPITYVQRFLELLLKRAANKAYMYLPTGQISKQGHSNKYVSKAMQNRIVENLNYAFVAFGQPKSGKSTIVKILCKGISKAIGICNERQDTKIHPKVKPLVELTAKSIRESEGLAHLYTQPCAYFDEYNPGTGEDAIVAQDTICSFLTNENNDYRFPYDRNGCCTAYNMSLFCGFNSDRATFFSFKAGNARRLFPVAFKTLSVDNPLTAKEIAHLEDCVSKLLRNYIRELMVLRNNTPYENDFQFSPEYADLRGYCEVIMNEITTTKNVLHEMETYFLGDSKDFEKSHPYNKRALKNSKSYAEAYKEYSYIHIRGRSVADIIREFYAWKSNGKATNINTDSQEVSRFQQLLDGKGIVKQACRLLHGDNKTFKAYCLCFAAPSVETIEEMEERIRSEVPTNI